MYKQSSFRKRKVHSIKREFLIVINQEMRKLTKMILSEVGVGDLKIRPRGDNRCESAKFRDLNKTNNHLRVQALAMPSLHCATPLINHKPPNLIFLKSPTRVSFNTVQVFTSPSFSISCARCHFLKSRDPHPRFHCSSKDSLISASKRISMAPV